MGRDDAIICRMTMSKWHPNQSVPTYFVSAKPRKGCFTQINDAIQYAQPYSRIELLSGTYNEPVVINKCIEIGSEKGDEQAIITHNVVACVMQAKEAYIEGVTIRNTESQGAMRIDSGSPTIIRCEVAGIEVFGDSTPNIEECKLEKSAVHGLSVMQHAGGMYKGNSIINCGWYGIYVDSVGPATFMHNSVTECHQGQIIIRGNADVTPVFHYNRVIDQVRSSIDPNTLHHTQAYKLEHLPVKTAGQTVVLLPLELTSALRVSVSEDNTDDAVVSSSDSRCAIDVGGESHPSFVRNTIVGSMNNGFLIHGGAHGMYEHNYVTSNRGWAFVLDGATTKAMIVANSFTGNGGGIKCVSSPSIIHGKNEFVENRGPQLMLINGHENFEFKQNEVRSGTKIGVLCRDGGTGSIINNSFDQCGTAIRTEHGANPMVRENAITMSTVGVSCVRGGRGQFIENEIGNISLLCVLISSGANPTFSNCRFLTSNGGVLVTKGGRGSLLHCIIKDNRGAQLDISDRGNPYVTDCFIADGRDDGVRVHRRGMGTLTRNLIAGNERSKICIRTRGDPIIEQNIITRSHCDGILVEDEGLGTITNNVIERCRMSGVAVMAQSAPSVRGNIITLCREAGLHVGAEAGDGVYEKNEIFENHKTNVMMSGSGIAALHDTSPAASALPSPSSGKRKTGVQPQVTVIGPGASPAASSIGGDASQPAVGGGGGGEEPNGSEVAMVVSSGTENAMSVIRANKIHGAVHFGLIANSRCSALISHNLFHANHVGAIRVGTGSSVVILSNEFVAGSSGIVAVEDAKVRVLSNSFSDIAGPAMSFDEGTKGTVMWNTVEHCLHATVFRNSNGFCFLNAFIQSTDSAVVMGAQCRMNVRQNMMFEDEVGVRIEQKAKGQFSGNVIFESESNGIQFDGEEMQSVVEGNVILNAKGSAISVKKGNPKAQLNMALNSTIGVEVSGTHTSPNFQHLFISCCHKGVVWGPKSGGRIENTLIGHCDVGATFDASDAGQLKSCVIHNANAAGILATERTSGEVVDSILFKNFFNVFFTSECKLHLSASLLQAPVTFGIVCTKKAAPTIVRCVIASRALSHDEDQDDLREMERLELAIGANLKRKHGELLLKERFMPYEMKIRSMWEDLCATNATSVGGLPMEWLPLEIQTQLRQATSSVSQRGPYNIDDTASTTDVGDVLSDSRVAGGGGHSASGGRSNLMSSLSMSRPHSATSSMSTRSEAMMSESAKAGGGASGGDPNETSLNGVLRTGSAQDGSSAPDGEAANTTGAPDRRSVSPPAPVPNEYQLVSIAED